MLLTEIVEVMLQIGMVFRVCVRISQRAPPP